MEQFQPSGIHMFAGRLLCSHNDPIPPLGKKLSWRKFTLAICGWLILPEEGFFFFFPNCSTVNVSNLNFFFQENRERMNMRYICRVQRESRRFQHLSNKFFLEGNFSKRGALLHRLDSVLLIIYYLF